jgi:hypothetical protein
MTMGFEDAERLLEQAKHMHAQGVNFIPCLYLLKLVIEDLEKVASSLPRQTHLDKIHGEITWP